MIDSKILLNNPKNTVYLLELKGIPKKETEKVRHLLTKRNQQIKEVEGLRAKKNLLSREMGALILQTAKKKKSDSEKNRFKTASVASFFEPKRTAQNQMKKMDEMKKAIALLKTQLSKGEKELEQTQKALRQGLLNLPNLPDEKAPKGKHSEESPVIREDFQPANYKGKKFRPHWEIAENLNIYDQQRASKISGSLFAVLRGEGAKLLRALLLFAYKTYEKDYTELIVPSLVNSKTFTGTGHLPKFSDDAYHIEKDGLWLIPTGEVPLTALHAGEILKALPLKYMTHTPCFRREAGAAGEQTRGMQRLHEFHKLELVKICHPKESMQELELLLEDALKPIKALQLPWRVKDLCTGDLTFASARTYDIEVYSPGTGGWLEVSSVGLFTDYQTRRANIRFREGKRLLFPHALNGSGLATPRVWAAILEHYEQKDGRVLVPEVLRDFMNCQYIEKQI